MPFATYNDYLDELKLMEAQAFSMGITVVAGRTYDGYRSLVAQKDVAAPAIPATNAVLSKSDQGALNGNMPNFTGNLSIIGARMNSSLANISLVLIDRLVHTAGLSGTSTAEQVANLPTPALTRYTNGVGVQMAITIWVAVGTTASSVTVKYTNSDGTPNRVSPAVQIGATGFNGLGRMLTIPLADGDVGVRSVESVTLSGTTGTIGNFGVFLYKPIGVMFSTDVNFTNVADIISGGIIGFQDIDDDAFLSGFTISNVTPTTATGALIFGVT
jgi:hypothetical protein